MHDSFSDAAQTYLLRIFTDGIERYGTEGMVFPDKEAAWLEAAASTREIIGEMDANLQPGTDWRMDVTDAEGAVIYRFTFRAEDVSSA